MATSNYYVQDNSDIEEQKLEAAKGLYQSGNYSGSLKLYLDMVTASYSYKLYYEIGRCYYKLNDLEKAEEYFLRSIELEFFKNPSYVFLGNIYFKKDALSKAIEYWTLSYSYKPNDESVCLNLATSYFAKNMRMQSIFFYERYLKYAKNKTSNHYLEIKKNIENFARTGADFYQKAVRANNLGDIETAIQALEFAVQNTPMNFDVNLLLGKLYFKQAKYMQALIYFKQAHCIDRKSLDVLERLSATLLYVGDFTSAYCCLKRILPLIINNQREYLEILKNLKQLEDSFDELSYQGHEQWGDNYYLENNYQFALFEYENAVIIDGKISDKLDSKIQKIKSFINPEERIIKSCFEKGLAYHSTGDFKTSNKYFSKIMVLADEFSSDYKYAKARIVNV